MFIRSQLPSPLGALDAVTSPAGLAVLDFSDNPERIARLARARLPGAALAAGPAPAQLVRALSAYFDGQLDALAGLELDLRGSAFELTVWRRLRAIPPGETLGYAALGRELGRPAAARAVGRANALNPVALAVPCHRAIGANGSLVGYAGGLERKRWLLEHEGALSRAPALFARELAPAAMGAQGSRKNDFAEPTGAMRREG